MEISISVLLVSDEVMVRTGLRMLVGSWPPFKTVGEAERSPKALSLAMSQQPDIILLDLDSNDNDNADGLGFLDELQSASVESRIVILTSGQDPDMRLRAVRRGAMGVVIREKAPEDLRRAIERVHAGELWLDRSLTASIIGEVSPKRPPKIVDARKASVASLTERECTVARLVCQGLRNMEIAERLFISEATVRHHLTSILGKLEMANRFALIVFLYQQKFAHPPL